MRWVLLSMVVVLALGLFSILRGGRWNWNVVPRSRAINVLFWYGWFSAIAFGALVALGELR